jgi:hypothetical protein
LEESQLNRKQDVKLSEMNDKLSQKFNEIEAKGSSNKGVMKKLKQNQPLSQYYRGNVRNFLIKTGR